MPPIHFGLWQTVYGWLRELARRFLFQTIHDLALMLDREQAGREASPSGGVIDSQSVKAPAATRKGGMTPVRRSSAVSVTSPWTPTGGF